jgi:hypothetical protein
VVVISGDVDALVLGEKLNFLLYFVPCLCLYSYMHGAVNRILGYIYI